MKEPELLKETQKVAGHPQLSEWHNQLIVDGEERIKVDRRLESIRKSYRELTKQVETMQKDVDLFEARKALENKIQALEITLEECKYMVDKRLFDELKLECNKAKQVVVDLEAANSPMLEQAEFFQQLRKHFESGINKLEAASKDSRSALAKLEVKKTEAVAKSTEAQDTLDALQDEEKSRKATRLRLNREVEELAEKIANVVEEPDLTTFNQDLVQLSGRLRELGHEIGALKDRQTEVYNEHKAILNQQSEIGKEIESLRSISSRREANLKQYAPNLFTALQTMRRFKQEGKFRGRVYEPVRLEITPKDLRYARAIEGCLSNDLLNTILCTDPQDYELLATECNDRQKLRVNIASMTPGDLLTNYPPPFPDHELRSMGFDAFVLDLVEGPDQVLAHLCQLSRLHTIPVAHNPGARVNDARFEQKNFPVKSWIVGSFRSSLGFSAYGAKGIMTKSFEMSHPKVLNTGIIDEKAVLEKTLVMQGYVTQAAEKQALTNKLKQTETDLRDTHQETLLQKKAIEAARTAARQARVDYLKYSQQHGQRRSVLCSTWKGFFVYCVLRI